MRIKKYLLKKVEKKLCDNFQPVWIEKKGRSYFLRDIATGILFSYKFSNLAEIVERFDLNMED